MTMVGDVPPWPEDTTEVHDDTTFPVQRQYGGNRGATLPGKATPQGPLPPLLPPPLLPPPARAQPCSERESRTGPTGTERDRGEAAQLCHQQRAAACSAQRSAWRREGFWPSWRRRACAPPPTGMPGTEDRLRSRSSSTGGRSRPPTRPQRQLQNLILLRRRRQRQRGRRNEIEIRTPARVRPN